MMVFVPRVNILQWFLFLIESQKWMKEKLPMDLVEWKPKQKHDEENGWKIARSKHFAMTKMRAPGMNGANAIEYNDEFNVSFSLFFFSIYPHLILSLVCRFFSQSECNMSHRYCSTWLTFTVYAHFSNSTENYIFFCRSYPVCLSSASIHHSVLILSWLFQCFIIWIAKSIFSLMICACETFETQHDKNN